MSATRTPLTIVKIGGNIINDEAALSQVLMHLSRIKSAKILIHGGGKLATELAERLEMPQTLIEGRRVTDEGTLRIAVMVYAGIINKSIVAGLQGQGLNSIGLTGADLDLIRAKKRNPEPIDYGFAGDITKVNAMALRALLDSGATPVIAPLTHDGDGQLLNTNADTIANEVAKALSPHYEVTLIYSFELDGVLRDPSSPASVIPTISRQEFLNLKTNRIISGGMIPKLENAFRAIDSGVATVIIGNAKALPALLNGTAGTRIIHEH